MSTTPRMDLVEQLKALGINEKTAKFALSVRPPDQSRGSLVPWPGSGPGDSVGRLGSDVLAQQQQRREGEGYLARAKGDY